jgi:hypothetical protein
LMNKMGDVVQVRRDLGLALAGVRCSGTGHV